MAPNEWYTGTHIVNASATYDNMLCTPLSEETITVYNSRTARHFVDENGKPPVRYPSLGLLDYCYSDSYTTATPTTMPKFKKGDVIICNKDGPAPGNGWRVEKDEVFYVQGAYWNTYWLRVAYSTRSAHKDFSVLAEKIDDNCSIYNCNKESSNSYFPNLSHV